MDWELPSEGAAKKMYRITEKGRNDLLEWKKDIEMRKQNFETFLRKFEALNARR